MPLKTDPVDSHSRACYASYFRVNNAPYEYTKEEAVREVQRLLQLGTPAITVNWEMVDLNRQDAPLSPAQMSALADIRNKYADHPEVVRDFETVLGIH